MASNITSAPPKSGGSRGASFPKSGQGGGGVKVSPGKGGVNIGTPTRCTSKRSADNLKAGYSQGHPG